MRHGSIPLGAALALTTLVALAARASAADDAGEVRIRAHAQVGATTLPTAEFEFACHPGKGRALQIAVVLPPPESVRNFPLDHFEGPDGIGETHDFAEWSVGGAAKPARARTTISGWRGVGDDGFLLAKARDARNASDLARLAKRLVSSEQARLRLVVKAPAHKDALKVEAAIAGHRAEIEQVLAPCLATVKK